MLPDYIAKIKPNPASNRAPWYTNTAPSYAGIFLWVVFYEQLAQGTLERASPLLCLLALVLAGVLSYGLYYLVPAMLGMKTGYPLYVVGSSTFGTTGGYVMPGLLMGLLQIGWLSVATFTAVTFILNGVGANSAPMTPLFIVLAVVWGYVTSFVGVKGIQYVARMATFIAIIPLVMILVTFFRTAGGIGSYTPPDPAPFLGFTAILATVIGFFASAGAAGADFATNSRDAGDVRSGGRVGIMLAIIVAGGLPLLSIAGAHGLDSSLEGFTYSATISSLGGFLATSMFLLFALASIPSSCFCAFIAGNSFATMIPSVSRMVSTMVGATLAVILAFTGIAANLVGFFNIVGASFGPICGAMVADYLLSGRKWAGPRPGINFAGYGAWAVGFVIGIIPFLPVSEAIKNAAQPAVVYSFIAGFIVYAILAKAGLEPKAVSIPKEGAPAEA